VSENDLQNVIINTEKYYKIVIPIVSSISILYLVVLQTVVVSVIGYVFENVTVDYKTIFKIASCSKSVFFVKNACMVIILFFITPTISYNHTLPLSLGHLFNVGNYRSLAYNIELFIVADFVLFSSMLFKIQPVTKSLAYKSIVAYGIVLFLHIASTLL